MQEEVPASIPYELRDSWIGIRTHFLSMLAENCDLDYLLQLFLKYKHKGAGIADAIGSEYFGRLENKEESDEVYGPKLQKGTEVVGYERRSALTVNDITPATRKSQGSDIDRALQESIRTRTEESNPEQVVRKPEFTAGIHNSRANCWFNAITQMLYTIPKFRSLLYHSVPCTWEQVPITNCEGNKKQEAEFLFLFRKLLAELQFTERKYVVIEEDLFKNMDALHCRSKDARTILDRNHQDVNEMLMKIMEWLECGLDAAIAAHQNPALNNAADEEVENMVIDESTATAPNSDVAGTACPEYDISQPSTSSHVHRAPKSRANSPTGKIHPVATRPKAAFGQETPIQGETVKEEAKEDEEKMDCGEESPRKPAEKFQPGIQSSPVTRPEAPEPRDEATQTFYEELKNSFLRIFESKRVAITKDGKDADAAISGRPEPILLTVPYGNVNDALEDYMYDLNTKNFYLFDQLPGAIFFSLNRYKNGTEKLHSRFTFEKELYMDRYMKKNLEGLLEFHNARQSLRDQLSVVKAQLKGIREYPNGQGGHVGLIDTFKVVLDVLRMSREKEAPTSPGGHAQSLLVPEKVHLLQDQGKIFPVMTPDEELNGKLEEQYRKLQDEEQQILQKQKQLEEEILKMERELAGREDLKETKYELHSIVVHQGDMQMGHYWMFKKKYLSDGSQCWEKLNDTDATRVEWSEIEKESYGNGLTSSPCAYLLMYVKTDDQWLMAPEKMDEKEAHQNLPQDLQDFTTRIRVEWRNRIQRFRDENQRSEAETSSQFFFMMDSDLKQDENANPQILEGLEKPLEVLAVKFIANDWDIRQMDNRIQWMWNAVNRIDAKRYADQRDLVHNHYKMLMAGDAMDYLQQELGLASVPDDADNDFVIIYNKFITGFPTKVNSANFRNNPIFFIASKIHPSFQAVLIRYILVQAMIVGEPGASLKRIAYEECKAFVQASSDKGEFCERLTSLIMHTYEVFTLGVWACRYTMESSIQIYNKRIADTCDEYFIYNYLTLIAAKIARFCYRLLVNVGAYRETKNDMYLCEPLIGYTTLVATMSMLRGMMKVVLSRHRSLSELEVMDPSTEQRIRRDLQVDTLCEAMQQIKVWSADTAVLDDKTQIELMTQVQQELKAKFECVGQEVSPVEKQELICRLLAAIDSLPGPKANLANMEAVVVTFECDCKTMQQETEMIEKYINDFGNLPDRVKSIMDELTTMVQAVFNGDFDRMTPPHMLP